MFSDKLKIRTCTFKNSVFVRIAIEQGYQVDFTAYNGRISNLICHCKLLSYKI